MTSQTSPEITHAAVLLHTDEHWLLQLRDKIPTIIQPGAVSPWGGVIEEEDANPKQAALRELEEETGLQFEPYELEPLRPLDYRESRMRSDGTTEELAIRSQVFLAHRANIAPFTVGEGQGLLYVALARLFLAEAADLRMTQELDLTINHLVEIEHPIVAEALNTLAYPVSSHSPVEPLLGNQASQSKEDIGRATLELVNRDEGTGQGLPAAERPLVSQVVARAEAAVRKQDSAPSLAGGSSEPEETLLGGSEGRVRRGNDEQPRLRSQPVEPSVARRGSETRREKGKQSNATMSFSFMMGDTRFHDTFRARAFARLEPLHRLLLSVGQASAFSQEADQREAYLLRMMNKGKDTAGLMSPQEITKLREQAIESGYIVRRKGLYEIGSKASAILKQESVKKL